MITEDRNGKKWEILEFDNGLQIVEYYTEEELLIKHNNELKQELLYEIGLCAVNNEEYIQLLQKYNGL